MASSSRTEKTSTESRFTGEARNRLAQERSPYLLQHATNPVDWYPWGEEAFQKARSEDKLIFLSIGYSTCHWCHVMERESFENKNIASIMNEYFVNVKVDREERPDVDRIYMTFVQAVSGSGGWPMSVFLTPDLKPVAGGTYFPPEDNYGRPGFKSVLLNTAKQWMEQRQKLSATGTKITELLRQTTVFDVGVANQLLAGTTPPGQEVWELCFSQVLDNYEPEFGGFSQAPKFPQGAVLSFLTHLASRERPQSEMGTEARQMLLHTLDKMAAGGINDHIFQGFARYSTDREWHVPHFEKMLYDQAQLSVVYTNAYLLTHNEKYAKTARGILEYVMRDLSHPDGGFYSAEDADSYPTKNSVEKREGAFCVWTHEEVATLIGDRKLEANPKKLLVDLFCAYYTVRPEGNVPPEKDHHREFRNQNVLAVFRPAAKICKEFGLKDEATLDNELAVARKILYDRRLDRPRPHLDNKIITSWNGMMISGFAKAGSALGDDDFTRRAIDAANFVRRYLLLESGKLLRSCYTDLPAGAGIVQIESPIEGFLDDYVCLVRGLLDLYECTLNSDWIEWAERLQMKQDELFWDHGHAGYFSTISGDTNTLFRLKEDHDGAEPCGNSIAAGNLLRLGTILDSVDMMDKAKKLLTSFSGRLTRVPLALPEMTSALMLYNNAPTQVVVTGDPSDSETMALVNIARRSLLVPGLILMVTSGNPDSFLCRRNQSVRKMKKPEGNYQAAFVCRGRTCSLPVTTPADLAALLKL
ncbi:hypothetical protein AAG570_005719 [Ranatra chinensis]|uniref:Spermatogenesis-associated protein 20-like TRX domain-containing protein n=1 Tax=Ranatra chinensis TaxID=642074 RepID=A0ABD0YGM2_9HEMI